MHCNQLQSPTGYMTHYVHTYTHLLCCFFNAQHSQAKLESEVRAVARRESLGDEGIKIK